MDKGQYFTSTTEFIKVETIVEERQIREEIKEEKRRTPEIPPPQSTTERDDDWFVVLDVVPRETLYVPPGITKISMCVFQKNFGSLVLYFVLCCYIHNIFVASYPKTLL